jgi:hypothetical protein
MPTYVLVHGGGHGGMVITGVGLPKSALEKELLSRSGCRYC